MYRHFPMIYVIAYNPQLVTQFTTLHKPVIDNMVKTKTKNVNAPAFRLIDRSRRAHSLRKSEEFCFFLRQLRRRIYVKPVGNQRTRKTPTGLNKSIRHLANKKQKHRRRYNFFAYVKNLPEFRVVYAHKCPPNNRYTIFGTMDSIVGIGH